MGTNAGNVGGQGHDMSNPMGSGSNLPPATEYTLQGPLWPLLPLLPQAQTRR